MDHQISKILIRLRHIALIPENGRLDTTNGDIELYSDSWINWFCRILNKDGRIKSIETLRTFYTEVVALNNSLMDAKNVELTQLNSIYTQLGESVKGLKNIREGKTYKNDPNVASVIGYITDDLLKPHMAKLHHFLKLHESLTEVPLPIIKKEILEKNEKNELPEKNVKIEKKVMDKQT